MHPGLASAQGPALSIYIDKLILGTEDLIKLLTKTSLIPMLSNEANEKHERRSSINGEKKEDPKNKYPTTGKKLTSAFAITDCLQVLSGSQHFVFDPLGQHLLSDNGGSEGKSEGKSAPSVSSSRA